MGPHAHPSMGFAKIHSSNVLRIFLALAVGVNVSESTEWSSATCEDRSSSRSYNPGLIVKRIKRVNNISVAEFKERHSHPDVAVPLVIENAMSDVFDASQWTRKAIGDECGHFSLIRPDCEGDPDAGRDEDCHQVQFVNEDLIGKVWAGLEHANLDSLQIKTVKDLLQKQDTPEGSGLYLHDASLRDICPPLTSRIYFPKYFPRDYRLMVEDWDDAEEMITENGFPSIFISKKGASSMLHADADLSRFWVVQLSGKKLWRVVPPSEYTRVYPNKEDYASHYYPMEFHADIMNPDYNKFPLLNGTHVYEAVLSAGDVIFVPEGWAHQVLTLEDAVSTTYNFVDFHSIDTHLKNHEFEVRKEQEDENTFYKRFLTSFIMPVEVENEETSERSISLEDFFGSHLVQHLPVPQSVKDFVRTQNTSSEETHPWGSEKAAALHLAVRANFVSVAKYLLEEGGADISVKNNRTGDTPLTVADDFGYEEMHKLLLEHSKQHLKNE